MKYLSTIVAIALLTVSPSLWAKAVYFDASLDGMQANNGAGSGSPGTGSATSIAYDSVSRVLTWDLSWNSLEANVTIAHIHGPAIAGASGPPLISLDTATNPTSGSAQLSRQQIDYLFAGQLYVNIQTSAHPEGEIRGQILPQTTDRSVIGTLQRGQWHSLVLSGNPQGLTVEQLFSGESAFDLQAQSYENNWILYTFNPNTQNFNLLELSDSVQQGQAFWMIQIEFDSHEIVIENLLPHAELKPLSGCSSIHGCVSIPIADQASTSGGWAFVGSPYQSEGENVFEVADLAVRSANGPANCQSGCSFDAAIDANLVGATLYSYDTSSNTYLSLGSDDRLRYGQAFWISIPAQTQASAIDLIVPYRETDVTTDPELAAITDFQYAGAFRLKNGDFGDSSLDYAVGTLAINPIKQSLFIAGHDHDRAVAEYPLIAAGMQTDVASLPETAPPLQNFSSLLDLVPNPQTINRITGLYWFNGSLIVNAENWYDAGGVATDTTLVVPDADNLAAVANGFFRMQGGANAAGYMGPIPEQWQSAFGAQHFTGWSSVYSITSRYSIGPSLWTFDPNALISADPVTDPIVVTQPKMNYPFAGFGTAGHLSERALEWAQQGTPGPFPPADALWNQLSAGMYGFFIPGTKTFAVIGHTSALQSGMAYKALQSDGHQCGGPCPFDPADHTNYYWFYNVDDILSATNSYDPKPYAYGSFDVPFDADGTRPVLGATFDQTTNTLYLAIKNAAQLGTYDRPPLIVTYKLEQN